MVDLRTQYHSIKEEIQTALNATLESTAFIMGPNVQAFENEVADYLNCQHALSCSSGTDALHLALRALGLQAGDEVIRPRLLLPRLQRLFAMLARRLSLLISTLQQ
jgi:dTDP-4-amino-4,6-dideoxygalactose transaminase